ncbi:hypothetical protein HanRHA438_Chr04g0165111 [Helianthus annuus]|nr:hypothetical protein HanRHA438_Chr04g0165111 [Helianthus annuus]
MIVCISPFSTSTSLMFPSESSLITFLGLVEEVTSCSILLFSFVSILMLKSVSPVMAVEDD